MKTRYFTQFMLILVIKTKIILPWFYDLFAIQQSSSGAFSSSQRFFPVDKGFLIIHFLSNTKLVLVNQLVNTLLIPVIFTILTIRM